MTTSMKPEKKPRQIVARYPNHVWSVDRTRVWRWRIWPTWVLVAIDHFSRKVVAVCPLEDPNAGWVVEALEETFLRHGAPKHVLRKYSSARQDSHLYSLDSESGPGLLPAASHYRGTKAQGPFGDFEQRRSSTRLTNADLT